MQYTAINVKPRKPTHTDRYWLSSLIQLIISVIQYISMYYKAHILYKTNEGKLFSKL